MLKYTYIYNKKLIKLINFIKDKIKDSSYL